jgi:hypothetical protein
VKKTLLMGVAGTALLFGGSAQAADLGVVDAAPYPDAYEAAASGLLFSGTFDLFGGYTWFSENVGNADGLHDNPFFGGAARASVPWTSNFSTQFDLEGAAAFISDDEDDPYAGSVVGAVHASFRDPSGWLFGGFAGGGAAWPEDEETGHLWFAGIESQLYLNNFTLYGQAGYLDSIEADGDDSDTFHNAWFVRGVARYFVGPNTMLQGEIAYAQGDQDSSSKKDMDIIAWGAEVEHSLSAMPVSLFAAYEGAHYDNGHPGGDTGRFVEHTGLAGIKFRFGTDTLLDNDRLGATLDTPRFGRWVAAGDSVD